MLELPSAQNLHYIVMGLGRSGLATCLALQRAGAHISAWDDDEQNRNALVNYNIELIPPASMPWSTVTALILSPGIPHRLPQPHITATYAHKANIPIICDIELLAQNYSHSQSIGITGTNGKSTTTALIHHILSCADKMTAMGGNIGIPVCELPSFEATGIYVLELSSYQLERIPTLNLDVAVLLNITTDHLSRHGTMDDYINVKKHIFDHQKNCQWAIISVDDEPCRHIFETLQSSWLHKTVVISTQRNLDRGLYIENGWLIDAWWQSRQPVLDLIKFDNLPGHHNWQNILCAYAVARIHNINPPEITDYISTFINLPHRLEYLGAVNGIKFINDSKATNPESTIHALSLYNNIYWIVGGSPKDSELNGLENHYDHVQQAYTIGQATHRFTEILQDHSIAVTPCHNLDHAVQLAYADANKYNFANDGHRHNNSPVILLSPACASFDQFKDFEHRGETFRYLFNTIKQQVEENEHD